MGSHVDEWWKRILWIALTATALGLLAHTRILRPLGLRRRPWRIAEVRPEHTGTVTLALEPVGHLGLEFESGHHVFLTLGNSPFSLQQHPFTIASSDQRPERIELTIKDLGDFTRTVQTALPGGRAFLEGPYGGAWLYTTGGEVPLVMLAGGIGITPFISAILTHLNSLDVPVGTSMSRSSIWYEGSFQKCYGEAAGKFGFTVQPCAILGQSMGGAEAIHTAALDGSPFAAMVHWLLEHVTGGSPASSRR